MSFTAQVKDEISRVKASCDTCLYAEMSAILRVCGTLSFHGSGHYSLRISTETGSVARTMVKLAHTLFDLQTLLTVRHSNLHKTRNYLIEIPEQEQLEAVLVRLGILLPGRGIASGVPFDLLQKPCCAAAFIRGAFLAGGFIANPRGDFHLEITVEGQEFAEGILKILHDMNINARLNHRRGSFVIYLKSFDEIKQMLLCMDAKKSALALQNVRQMKSVKNRVNRKVNAELANQKRTSGAAVAQLALIDEAEKLIGFRALPPALREFCLLRRENTFLSLSELGQLCSPKATKSALHHRVLRLEALVKEAKEQQ